MDRDDLAAMQWQSSELAVIEPIIQESLAECDDYWFVPPYCPNDNLVGQLEEISKDTSTHLTFKEQQQWLDRVAESLLKHYIVSQPKRVDIWGSPDCIQRAKHALDHFARYYLEVAELLIAGDDEDKVYSAMNRVKNFILKRIKQYDGTICHILEKPSKLVEIGIHESPQVPYVELPIQLIPPRSDKVICGPERFLVATELAEFENLRELDLRMATIGPKTENTTTTTSENANAATSENDKYFQLMKYSEGMTDKNITKIRKTLEEALEHVQLLDGDIKMRIRFGQVALMNYPEQVTWDIKELDTRIIPDGRLLSDFSPFFTKSSDKFSALIKKLTPPNQKTEFLDAHEMLWTLGIIKRDQLSNKPIEAQVEVSFREDDKVAFWNALVQKTTPLDIRVISSERPFSWTWNISASKRLDADKFSPEGKFIHEIHLEKRDGFDSRIVYSTTNDVQLRHIKRERKWLFARDPWTIELAEESYWTLDRPSKPFQKLTLSAPPQDVLYSVSMYRESWVERFCENPHLGLGQLPSWEPSHFFEWEESIGKTLDAVSEVRSIIEGLF
ncbi:hypothetical protein BGX20_006830 [Mortierella sp. AD010]|nr:hypothetical protein BGX20_006830 [Mortierella sp. AD010]